ncbi:MAG: trypsin-like peptidase domain-containing protein [Candidatus Brocadiae bacterium]|nr:trypsin-like peptidase domain-containing protein [Candidatus Brocadiia bacterium]
MSHIPYRNRMILFLCFYLFSAVFAQQLKLEEIVWLKESGVSESEILAEVKKTSTSFSIKEKDVLDLRQKGFSDSFIRSLGPWPFKDEVTLENIIAWVKEKQDEKIILERIQKSEKIFSISVSDRLKLKREGVSERIIQALADSSKLKFDLLKLWYQSKIDEKEILKRLSQYSEFPKLSVREILNLKQMGMSKEVLEKINKATPSQETVLPVKEAVAEQFATYQDITGLFSIEYPEGWNILTEVKEKNSFRMCFTPEPKTKKIVDVKLGISVTVAIMEGGSVYDFLPIETVFQRFLPGYLLDNQKYQLKILSDHKMMDLEGTKAVFSEYSAVMDKTPVLEDLLMVAKDRTEFFVHFTSPTKEKPKYAGIFHRMRESLRFSSEKLLKKRSDIPMNPASIIAQAKEATVLITADFENGMRGTGTGFLISEDGYIITNHHVCYSHQDKMKKAARLFVSWDSKVGKKELPAYIVAAWFQETPVRKDLALLKIEGSNYTYLPLASPQHSMESDRVITFGFPRTDVFGRSNITVTEGTIIRLVENLEGKLDTIFIDAKITHGNSGGPCFSLNLGGVIGINTAVHKGDLLGYNITLPVSIALEEFPEIYYSSKTRDALDHLKLASLYKGKSNYRGAARELLIVTEKDPKNDVAWAMLGETLIQESFKRVESEQKILLKEAILSYQKALEINPKSESALYGMGSYYWQSDNKIEAFRYYDRLVSYYPQSVWPYNNRAYFYLQAGRFDEATLDAQKAIELNNNMHPDPYMMMGSIYYAQKKYEEGKAEYEKALRVNPNNLKAHYGKLDYFIYIKNFSGAEIEYARLLEQFQGIPEVLAEVGNFYHIHKKEETQALDYYKRALAIYKKTHLLPSLSLLRNTADLAYKIKDYAFSLETSITRLALEKEKIEQHDAMMVIGNCFYEMQKKDIAEAFYYLAYSIYKENQKLEEYLAKSKPVPLTLESLESLMKLFSVEVVAQLLLVCDLDFTISAEKFASLEGKLHDSILLALKIRQANSWKPIRPTIQDRKPTQKPEEKLPSLPSLESLLLKNMSIQIKKFYPKNNIWYVDFTVSNNNNLPVGNFVFQIVLMDDSQKVVKTMTVSEKKSVPASSKADFDNMDLVSYEAFSHIEFIKITIQSLQSLTVVSNPEKNLNLANNLFLQIPSFYHDGKNWYVTFTVSNKNSVSVGNFIFQVQMEDANRAILKTLSLPFTRKIAPGETASFDKILLIPHAQCPKAAFIYIKVVKVDGM